MCYIKYNPMKNSDTLKFIDNNIRHSFLEIFQSFFIKKTISHIVRNSSINENEVSCIK